jgi:exodeoxyribonuclease V alpha subunit
VRRAPPLSPLGTARERLLSRPGKARDEQLRLHQLLTSYNLGEEAGYLAWEVCRWVDGLTAAEERTLFLVVLASIVNLHQGSTRLPVRGPQVGFLGELLEHLTGSPQDGPLADMERLLDDPRLAPVLGAPGQYKPLILEGDYLYHQRTLHFEERLVAALARRLATPSFPLPPDDVSAVLGAVLGTKPARSPGPADAAGPAKPAAKGVELSAEQQYAALTALHSPLAVITGGPGTGKTSIVVAILRMLVRLGVPIGNVALAAPTGKAANRMKSAIRASLEAIGELEGADAQVAKFTEPRTLHRLLGYSPTSDRFRFHAQNRLPERVVIVDECSMIDLFLMNQLTHAVRDDARLVLLGDAEQLPSVEAGAVFRSLLPAGPGGGAMPWRTLARQTAVGALEPPAATPQLDARWRSAVRLTHSYRMDASRPAGRNILAVARLMNEGLAADLFPDDNTARETVTVRATAADVAFEKVELLEGPGELEALLERWLAERVRGLEGFDALVNKAYARSDGAFSRDEAAELDRLFSHHDGLRILCVTRGEARGTGSDAINARLHTQVRRLSRAPATLGFCPGEPVMMLHNDYDRELFNGDQGLVLLIDDSEGDGPEPMVVFRRGQGDFGVFKLESLHAQVARSYAMTVHKSQGSEFEHVLLVLPGENLPLLTREVLYTAVTRSKTSVVIAGQRALLEAGVGQPIERFSGVSDKLART